jgi:hypothetical protein
MVRTLLGAVSIVRCTVPGDSSSASSSGHSMNQRCPLSTHSVNLMAPSCAASLKAMEPEVVHGIGAGPAGGHGKR